MRDEQRRHLPLLLHRNEQVEHFVPERGAQRGERLVEQQHRPVAHQRTGQRDALALAAGKLARQPLLLAGKPGALERRRDPARGRRRESRNAGEMPSPTLAATSRCANRLFSWKIIETGRADGGSAVTSASPISTRPALRRLEAGDQVEQRRLAGAARPDQRGDLAGSNATSNCDRHLGIAERDAVEANRDACGGCRVRSSSRSLPKRSATAINAKAKRPR